MSKPFQYPAPPTTRRSGQRSEEYESSRGQFGISNVQFRVGAPPLRQLPLRTEMDSLGLSISGSQDPSRELDHAVYDILKKNGVIVNQSRGRVIDSDDPNRTEWFICSRSSDEMPYSSHLTLLVISPWSAEVADRWQNSARDLKTWVDSFLDRKSMHDLDLHIEIIDRWLYGTKYIAPIVDRPDLDKDWEAIKANVRSLLENYESLKTDWNCIGLFHYGLNKNATENPATIYISFDRCCEEIKWGPFRQALQQFLNSTKYGLSLHLEHSNPEFLARFELRPPTEPSQNLLLVAPATPYEKKANLGADISASIYTTLGAPLDTESNLTRPITPKLQTLNSTLGTLGCYVQIQFTAKGDWQTFILTNYHVVRCAIDGFERDLNSKMLAPAKTSRLYVTDHKGFKPSDPPFSIGMENPSRGRHNKTVAALDQKFFEATSKAEKQRWRQLRDADKSFFDEGEHVLGSLFAGSGFAYRTPNNGMLDWALIKPNPDRVGLNTLPAFSDWPADLFEYLPDTETHGGLLKWHVRKDSSMNSGQRGYKYGAISGATCGSYAGHLLDIKYKDWRYMVDEGYEKTSEHAFIPMRKERPFAKPGDSGAVVWNKQGRTTGLLFTGQSSADSADFVYVTPMEYVFSHIISFLGVKSIRIAQ